MTFVTAEPCIGHLGLGGVGDSKGLPESAMRDRHIKWSCNAKVTKAEAGKMFVAEHNDKGEVIKEHELPFAYSMMFDKALDGLFVDRMDGNEDMFRRVMQDTEFRAAAAGYLINKVYQQIRSEN